MCLGPHPKSISTAESGFIPMYVTVNLMIRTLTGTGTTRNPVSSGDSPRQARARGRGGQSPHVVG